MSRDNFELYLSPSFFIDSDHADVISYAHSISKNAANTTEAIKKLYLKVRDDFRYDPYQIDLNHKALKASSLLNRSEKSGYCIEKACLLAALARVIGIPSRLGFANVRNHIGTEKLVNHLRTDLMVFHGYTELYLNENWVKATPAFNLGLCEMLNVAPLEFDGTQDSILQEFDKAGNDYMQFEHDYGHFHDVPHDLFVREMIKHYPHLFTEKSMSKFGMVHHIKHYQEFLELK